MKTAYIGLGANLGDRATNLENAVKRLELIAGVHIIEVAPVIETEPVGGPPGQAPYLNTVAAVETELEPEALLAACLAIEQALGRARGSETRWGPRTLDLDLLLYGEAVIESPALTVPHPRLHERRFVLEPLAAIAPEARHPVLQQTVRELLDAIE